MPRTPKILRFEVPLEHRLEQSRKAKMPRFGYRKYRVYRKENPIENDCAGIKIGPLNLFMYGRKTAKKVYNQSQVIYKILDETVEVERLYETKWLKPKQATLLRLQGHRVEEV